MFSNLVATLRADLDAIRDDIGDFVETVKEDATEFVETVKTDANQVLGLVQSAATSASGSGPGGKSLSWEEQLWDEPELLCEDPSSTFGGGGADWLENLTPLKQEEIDMFLSAPADGIIPELYREIVPERATHQEFFQRLAFHRHRLTQRDRELQKQRLLEQAAASANLQAEEEEDKWDEEEEEEEGSVHVRPTQEQASVPQLLARIAELEKALKESEAKRAELELLVNESRKKRPLASTEKVAMAMEETETVAAPVVPVKEEEEVEEQVVESPSAIEAEDQAVAEEQSPPLEEEEEEPKPLKPIQATPSSSWEALSESVVSPSPADIPTPPAKRTAAATSNPLQVSLEDDEADDWD